MAMHLGALALLASATAPHGPALAVPCLTSTGLEILNAEEAPQTHAAALAHPVESAMAQETKPPTGRAQRELLEALLALDPVTVEGQAEIRQRLAPYADLPAPTGTKRRKLLAAIEKLWAKGPELPAKAGEYWYWDEGDDRKGRYFVAGQVRKPKGLFIGLHGGGVGSADASGAHGAFRGPAADRDWVALFPQAIEATERGWVDSGTEEWIVRLVEEARRTYGVPADKVFIGGHSMGGFGAWTLGAHHADLFAAALPAAGAPSPIYDRDGSIYGIETGVIPNLRNLPMCVFQSTDDPRVPPESNQAAVRDVGRARTRWGGYDAFDYWEVDDRGHGFPEGGTDALLERIEGYTRNPRPDKVVWQPTLPWKTRFYWLDWPSPRADALVIAERFPAENRIEVVTDGFGVEGLALLLDGTRLDLTEEVVVTVDGEEVHRAVVPTSWATFVESALRCDPGRLYDARIRL